MTDCNEKPEWDKELLKLADYIENYEVKSELALETARNCLIDSIGCGLLALEFPKCTNLLGPWLGTQENKQGSRVLGMPFILDPVKAAFDMTCAIRWLDYNDTWLAAEWGHPSDNIGGLLATMDYMSRSGLADYTIKDLLNVMVKAYEIQGIYALENSFNAKGLDHVVLVKLATAGLATQLMGGDREQILNALSLVWVDGQSLRTYRHAPNTGTRKSWAAGDATSRGVRLAMLAMRGEMGYPSALSAKQWGFYVTTFKGETFKFSQEFGSYVMENILFKLSFPAEFHGQTAVECALKLHLALQGKVDDIAAIEIHTQAAGNKIINKTGPLHNPADRDHSMQYMVACALVNGKIIPESYEDKTASNPQIDKLRELMVVQEDSQYTKDYIDPEKRAISNRIEIILKNGESFQEELHYPVGHRLRRSEGMPILKNKFENALSAHFPSHQAQEILSICDDPKRLDKMPIGLFMDLFVPH